MKFFLFSTLLLAASVPLFAEPSHYITGGHKPLSPAVQAELDVRAESIRLGLNTEFLERAGFDAESFAQVVIDTVDQLPKLRTPGVVIYVDSIVQENIPIALGNRMVTPEKHPMEWSTYFDLGTLTAPVVTLPFLLNTMEQKRLPLNQVVEMSFPSSNTIDYSSQMPLLLGDLTRYSVQWNHRDEELLGGSKFFGELTPVPLRNSSVPHPSDWVNNLEVLSLALAYDNELTTETTPLKTRFFEEIALPLGMVNTSMDTVPDAWRSLVSPGALNRFHGRMPWGEAYAPIPFLLKEESVGGGMFSTADDLGIYARYWLLTSELGSEDFFSTQTLKISTQLQGFKDDVPHGHIWQLGQFGTESFGFTGTDGRALWMDPRHGVFCVILMNPEHLQGNRPKNMQPAVNALVQRLHRTLLAHKRSNI